MENIAVHSIDEVDDISSIDSYRVALDAGLSEKDALHLIEKYGRDNARTPFQWSNAEHTGFTTGTPWLRTNPNFPEINYEAEKDDPDSVFHYYKKLIRLRKSEEYKDALVYGDFTPYLEETHNLIAYFRTGESKQMLVLANFQNEPRTIALPGKVKTVALNNLPDAAINGDEISLEGYQAVVLEME